MTQHRIKSLDEHFDTGQIAGETLSPPKPPSTKHHFRVQADIHPNPHHLANADRAYMLGYSCGMLNRI